MKIQERSPKLVSVVKEGFRLGSEGSDPGAEKELTSE